MQHKDYPKPRRIKISIMTTKEPTFEVVKQAFAQQKTRYMHGSIAAQRLGISSHLLSRITGTIYVIQALKEEVAKYNVGLNLKFNKKNEEVREIVIHKFHIRIIKYNFIDVTNVSLYIQFCGSIFLFLSL